MPLGGKPIKEYYYADVKDVFDYLRITDYDEDEEEIVKKYLIWARDEIDEMTCTTYGLRESLVEYHTLGKPWLYGYWHIGAPIFTKYYPIYKVLELKVWNGGQYVDWSSFKEGRNQRWWLEKDSGRLFLSSFLWHAGGLEVKIKYLYGYGELVCKNESVCGEENMEPIDTEGNDMFVGSYDDYDLILNVPSYAKKYSVLYAARMYISSEFMIQRVAEGGAEDLKDMLARIDKEMDYYRGILQSYCVNAGDFIS